MHRSVHSVGLTVSLGMILRGDLGTGGVDLCSISHGSKAEKTPPVNQGYMGELLVSSESSMGVAEAGSSRQ